LLHAAIAVPTVAVIAAAIEVPIGVETAKILADVEAEAALDVVAADVAAALVAVSAPAVVATFRHPSTLRLKAKTAVVIAVTTVVAIAADAAIRIAAAMKIVEIAAPAVTLIAVRNLARPLRPDPPKNPSCCPANRWPNIAGARCRKLPLQ
jgi:hypothetical protein